MTAQEVAASLLSEAESLRYFAKLHAEGGYAEDIEGYDAVNTKTAELLDNVAASVRPDSTPSELLDALSRHHQSLHLLTRQQGIGLDEVSYAEARDTIAALMRNVDIACQ